MVIGLQPLEFADCHLDSPDFRENLTRHEKELEKTSQQIKRIIKEVKDLLAAAKGKKNLFIMFVVLFTIILIRKKVLLNIIYTLVVMFINIYCREREKEINNKIRHGFITT